MHTYADRCHFSYYGIFVATDNGTVIYVSACLVNRQEVETVVVWERNEEELEEKKRRKNLENIQQAKETVTWASVQW